ncbi:putative methyltransferase-domain-containing protein [Hypomontagnella monticulosa]|nr:putative methyltransferase-domain-containing protein [Hypomontagnella monticulosa]
MSPPQRTPSPEFSPLAIGEDLAPLPAYKSAGTASVDFSGLLADPLKLHEDLTSGCGGQTWPAGMVLAKHMLRYHRDDMKDSRIVELGAGGGLVGLAVAKGCLVENPLIITDQVEMYSLMEHNISLNGLESKAKAAILNWGEPLPQDIADLKPDVILAADCVYFEPAFPLLLATLSDLLRLCPLATVYFCFKKRRRADMQFLKKAQKMFRVTEVQDEDRPIFSREGLFLYTFQAL